MLFRFHPECRHLAEQFDCMPETKQVHTSLDDFELGEELAWGSLATVRIDIYFLVFAISYPCRSWMPRIKTIESTMP